MKALLAKKPVVVVLCLLLTGLVALLDIKAPAELDFVLFYLIPLLIAAWYLGERFAIGLCVLISGTALVDAIVHPAGMVAGFIYWDAITRFAAFLIVTWAVSGLRAANQRIRASEALREDLTNMLVHDLKNPLASATMALDMLRRGTVTEETTLDHIQPGELLSIAQESQERLGRLIEDILDIARAEAGAPLVLTSNPKDLSDIVHEAALPFRTRAENAGVKLQENYPPEPLLLLFDTQKVRRVMANLLDNALKNTPNAGRIEITVETDAAGARVTVRDTGPGIPKYMHKRIFEKFGQIEGKPTRARMSVGLGLAFAKVAIEAHGGRIWVESEPGRGSAFIFTLPTEPSATKAAGKSLKP